LAIVSENWAELLEPGLRKIFYDTYHDYPSQIPNLFNMQTSKKAVEHDLGAGTLSDIPEFEGTIEYQEAYKQYQTDYEHTEFASGIQITRKMLDDDLNYRGRNWAICKDEPKASFTDNVITKEMLMSQFAGKTFEDGLKLGWLACAIESEGSISLVWGRSKKKIQIVPKVNFSNKDKTFIEKVSCISKELGLDGYVYHRNNISCVTWYGFKRVKSLIETILPHLCGKKERAKKVVEFIDYRMNGAINRPYGEIEKNLFMDVRDLNGKGRISKQEIKCYFESSKESPEAICPTPN
jgi:hypothetical protein